MRQLFLPLLALLLVLPLQAKAQTTPTVNPPASNTELTTALSKLTLNQGVMYTIKANSVSYTMTTNIVSWKGLSLIGGYSSAAKAVAGIDYDLMNLKGVDIPILKYVDVHVGWAVSYDNIGGRNVVDNGPVVTIAQLSF